jgi:ABC-type antimicrobial peptide transport system permease subunit
VNPELALTIRPLADQLRTSVARDRLMAQLAGSFGALALVLSAIGLYGVTAYSVSRRQGEIGIRTALGATPGRVIRGVLSRVAGVIVVGVAAGVGISLWVAPTVASLMYEVGPRDPITLVSTAGAVTGVGLLAGWLPARRAARIDPVAVLRKS